MADLDALSHGQGRVMAKLVRLPLVKQIKMRMCLPGKETHATALHMYVSMCVCARATLSFPPFCPMRSK